MLDTIPHVRFLDLAIIFYGLVTEDSDGIMSIRITNEHLKSWKKSIGDLLEVASKNTPILFPGVIRSMVDVIKDLIMKNPLNCLFDVLLKLLSFSSIRIISPILLPKKNENKTTNRLSLAILSPCTLYTFCKKPTRLTSIIAIAKILQFLLIALFCNLPPNKLPKKMVRAFVIIPIFISPY